MIHILIKITNIFYVIVYTTFFYFNFVDDIKAIESQHHEKSDSFYCYEISKIRLTGSNMIRLYTRKTILSLYSPSIVRLSSSFQLLNLTSFSQILSEMQITPVRA